MTLSSKVATVLSESPLADFTEEQLNEAARDIKQEIARLREHLRAIEEEYLRKNADRSLQEAKVKFLESLSPAQREALQRADDNAEAK